MDIMEKLGSKYNVTFDFKDKHTWDAKGCKECNYTGYFGRIACFEILEITDEIRELISEQKSSMEIKRLALKQGYLPLAMDGLNKVLNGVTTLEELNKKLVLFQ